MGLSTLAGLVPALIIGAACIAGICRGVDVFSALTAGAAKGLRIMRDIFPALVVLFPAIYLLRASGLPEHIGALLRPLLSALGIPEETVLLMLLRPVSGSAALSAAADVISRCGADSLAGRTAARHVLLKRHDLLCHCRVLHRRRGKGQPLGCPRRAVCGRGGFLSAAWICRILWG